MSSQPYPQLKRKFAHLNSNHRHQQAIYLWRSLVVGCISSFLLLALMLFPRKITKLSQVVIKSDRSININKIYQQLDIYLTELPISESEKNKSQLPSFLDARSPWVVSSKTIISRLESISAIENVRVTKTIFPPIINIYLQEKIPVVTAISSGRVGFLDQEGNWLEPSLYNYQSENLPLTKIKVINFKKQNKGTYVKLFQLISAYPQIGVREIIWSDTGNLSIVTENMRVRFGSNSTLIQQQFEYLTNFSHKSLEKAAQDSSWLDLTNPDSPFLE